MINSLTFPETKGILVSGDIHGDFNQLVFKLCIQHQVKHSPYPQTSHIHKQLYFK